MKDIVKQFLPPLKEFFCEWARFVKENIKPATLANYFLDQMRSENASARAHFTALSLFMRSRSWPEFFDEIKNDLSEEDRTIFASSTAEPFYVKFRTMITAQIEDYWNGFMETYRAVNEELEKDLNEMPVSKLEATIERIALKVVKIEMETLNRTIIDEIKKHFDQGESWKEGSEEPEEPEE